MGKIHHPEDVCSPEAVTLQSSEPKKQKRARPQRPHFKQFNGSVLCPSYNTEALESHFLKCAFEPARWRFRFAIAYVAVFSLVWGIFTQAFGLPGTRAYLYGGLAVLVVCGITFGITFMDLFRLTYRIIGSAWALFLVAIILGFFAISPPVISYIVMIGACVQIIIVIYSLIPIAAVFSVSLTILLSVAFELLMYFLYDFNQLLFARIMVQISAHFIGIYLHVSSQSLLRSTFYRQCKSVHTKRQLRIERAAELDNIRSLMPAKVAQELIEKVDSQLLVSNVEMNDNDANDEDDEAREREVSNLIGRPLGFHVFHEFNGCQIKDVSILYADIIGIWTVRDSVQETVKLLNDIYTCLDQLCDATGCEKISTLGDCYHCVSGCPDPVEDHAERCIEFGRAMCAALPKFQISTADYSVLLCSEMPRVQLQMRVGIHSGTVVYGIMGVHRFRFDVWSNDVNLARSLKSSGENGRVHISEDTLACVGDRYEVVPAQSLKDIRKSKVLVEYFDSEVRRFRTKETQESAELRTFFVVRRTDGKEPVIAEDSTSDAESEVSSTPHRSAMLRLVEDMRHEHHSSLTLSGVHPFTLNFLDRGVEERYRCRRLPLVTYLIPSLILLLVLVLICGATASLPSSRSQIPLIIIAPISSLFLLLLFLPMVQHQWWPRNIASTFVLLLPVIVVFSRAASCPPILGIGSSLLILPSIAVSCLPSSISFWSKVVSSTVVFIAACPMLLVPQQCLSCPLSNVSSCNSSRMLEENWPVPQVQSGLAWLFTLVLVIFMARELEIAQRLSFLCNETAKKEQRAVRRAKLQADWLLRNIIPHRIADEFQVQKSYFREVNSCGVIFADISNFSFFYDEQFHGGQAMLGVLNEIFADIERLMLRAEYRHNVEKIKTVGSCFMAASGLIGDTNNWEQARLLLNFCLDVRTTVMEFNKSMFSFDFELKIGLSVGPLSAGVFGRKRLLYDILGDTVNQAFCLCSAAQSPGIRVPISVADRFSDEFVFEPGEELSGRAASLVQTCLLIRRR